MRRLKKHFYFYFLFLHSNIFVQNDADLESGRTSGTFDVSNVEEM